MGLLSDLKDNVNRAEEVLLRGYPADASQSSRNHESRASHKPGPSSVSAIVERLSSSRFLHYLDAVDSLQRVIETCPPRVASTKQLMAKAKSLLQQALLHLEDDLLLLLRASAVPPSPEQVHSAARSLPAPNSETGSASYTARSSSTDSQKQFNDGLPNDTFLLFPKTVAACIQALAARLIASGREDSCLSTYAQVRKAWLDSAVNKLCDKGQLRPEEISQLEWEALEARVLTWQTFAKITVRVLLSQERKLCNFVFQGNTKLTSRCFGELAGGSGSTLTGFVEAFALDKKLPERLFSMLDCCETLGRVDAEFLMAFQGESRECVRLRCEYNAVQRKVGLAALRIFAEFEAVVERDTSRVPGGGPGAGAVPRSTSYVMNYLGLLHEYRDTLVSLLSESQGVSTGTGSAISSTGSELEQGSSWRKMLDTPAGERRAWGRVGQGGSMKLSGEIESPGSSLQRSHASFHGERATSGVSMQAALASVREQGEESHRDDSECSDDEEGSEYSSDEEEDEDRSDLESAPPQDAASREYWADGIPEYEKLAEAVLHKLGILKINYEGKAKQQIAPRDPALAALFLMNNVHYIARKVKETELRRLLGDDWIRQQAYAVRKHADSYIQVTWGKIAATLKAVVRPEGMLVPLRRSQIKQVFKEFNATIEEIHRAQCVWLVSPGPLRDELRVAVKQFILPLYSDFYDMYAIQLLNGRHPTKYVKYDPLSARDLIMELFSGNASEHARKS